MTNLQSRMDTGHTPIFVIRTDRIASVSEIYLLKPGDVFRNFGGSKAGLLVRETPSLIIREISPTGQRDSEHDFNDWGVWSQILRAVLRVDTEVTNGAGELL